eukprot:TRINITY_DN32763_c0_g1_i1.p1 TRINITY_DN32763_c0_g1~~TRINITY_DN32763_c0_g1_i1.p1  ORF type:complete len:1738 (+),score=401.23 TRINITY_DN32763_c0_g1_i1:113-5215(+)
MLLGSEVPPRMLEMKGPGGLVSASDVVDIAGAADAGFVMFEDDNAIDVAENEETELHGDDGLLSASQREALLRLQETRLYASVKLKRISQSFSGSSVYFFSPVRKDGTPMPPSVLKLDTAESVLDEVEKTSKYANLFGLTTPRVKEVQQPLESTPDDPSTVMQIDLCGGVFGLPEFVRAAPVRTFASVMEEEMATEQHKVDVLPLINEALERRMYGFTMSSRSVCRVDLMKMYKILQNADRCVLNRAREGKKRAQKAAALAAGYFEPEDIDELDVDGCLVTELTGARKTVREFYEEFCSHGPRLQTTLERSVVCGLCHNDLHGSNLLLDSQGLVWLIDFATVTDDKHCLADIVKFLSACLFMYLPDTVPEEAVRLYFKLLATTPDANTALPRLDDACLQGNSTMAFLFDLLERLRHIMCIYEDGDDAPSNDGLPFVTALLSWSTRMLSYSEPSWRAKQRALYCSMACSQRLLWEAGVDVGPVARSWLEGFRALWQRERDQRLRPSVFLQTIQSEYELELPRFLSQVGAAEAWTTDFLTREQLHVADHCINVAMKFSGRVYPRVLAKTPQMEGIAAALEQVHRKHLPEVLNARNYFNRLLIVGDSGTGKSMLTRQLFSEAAQGQVAALYGCSQDSTGPSTGYHVVPIRVPLIEWARMLEAEPNLEMEVDPEGDILTCWMRKKYGHGSAPVRMLIEVRKAQVALRPSFTTTYDVTSPRFTRSMKLRPSFMSAAGDNGGQDKDMAFDTTKSMKSPRLSRFAKMDDTATPEGVRPERAALFLLLDGFDEAVSMKHEIMDYLGKLLVAESGHYVVMTSRPESLSQADLTFLSSLSFNSVHIEALDDIAADKLTRSILKRVGEDEVKMDILRQMVLADSYKVLRQAPFVLTLLVHVLRRCLASHTDTLQHSRSRAEAALKKTQIYQRAIRLMLHQSDTPKYLLQNNESDQAMVKRLEILKSSRARQFFQRFAWEAHSRQTRTLSWDAIRETSDDPELFSIFKEAVEEGRVPMFEQVVAAAGDPMVQMRYLSFQEILCSEYACAVIRHACEKSTIRAFLNVMLSDSCKRLDRGRLSDSWWQPVWLNVCDMLAPDKFNAWCDVLAEDERAHLTVGTKCYLDDNNQCRVGEYRRTKQKQALGETEDTELDLGYKLRSNKWATASSFEVTTVDWSTHRVHLQNVRRKCLPRFTSPDCIYFLDSRQSNPYWFAGSFTEAPADAMVMSDIFYEAHGVASLLRAAVHAGNFQAVKGLVSRGVHYGCADQDFKTPFNIAISERKHKMFKTLLALNAEVGSMVVAHMTLIPRFTGNLIDPAFLSAMTFFASQHEIRQASPAGVFAEALVGKLTMAGAVAVNPNAEDPTTGMTVLMYAAASGNAELVAELLFSKGDVFDRSPEGCTALTFATECTLNSSSSVRCMKLLIDARADVNHRSGKSYLKVCQIDRNGQGNPLGNAVCLLGHYEKLQLLLREGYQVNLGNDYNIRPIHWAGKRGDMKMVELLLEARAELLTVRTNSSKAPRGNVWKMWPLMPELADFNMYMPANYDVEYMRLLFKEGFDCNKTLYCRPDFPTCHFRWACESRAVVENEDLTLPRLFFENGYSNLDINRLICNYWSWTCTVFSLMAQVRNFHVVTLCLEHKADPDLPRFPTALVCSTFRQNCRECLAWHAAESGNAGAALEEWERKRDEEALVQQLQGLQPGSFQADTIASI